MSKFSQSPNADFIPLLDKMDFKEQEKVLLSIIAQSRFEYVIQMVRNGYRISVTVLEALRNSGQITVIEDILNGEFSYSDGNSGRSNLMSSDASCFCAYLTAFFGAPQAAAYFRHKADAANQKGNRAAATGWERMLNAISNDDLVKQEMWAELFRRKAWKDLSANGQHDLIINGFQALAVIERKEAAKNLYAHSCLSKEDLLERILQLEAPEWLVFMPRLGVQRLFKEGHFKLLYQYRKDVVEMDGQQLLNEFCKYERGRRLLFEQCEFNTLIANGCSYLLVKAEMWSKLAQADAFDAINWKKWHSQEQAVSSPGRRSQRLDFLYQKAVEAGQFWLLREDNKRMLLLKHRQYRMWWQTFSLVRGLSSVIRKFESSFSEEI